MRQTRFNARTVLLILAEAMLLFGGMIIAVYMRLGTLDADS